MLGFRYVCQRHQQLFADTVAREGCCDPEKMEKARRRLLAWLSEKFPRLVLDQFNNEACLGCAIEKARLDTRPIYDAVRQIVREIA
jgi:hypothetical protein